ncbi:MAG: ABC transporter substrate-binding protein [Erysipelotrichaceae bacterium]|nr:ABC transporter substrate-binding protein [Erysipelotrichaceae bacterium]
MKKLLSIVFALLLLTACAGGGGSNGEGEKGGELYVFLPGEYISDDVINNFEEETGIKLYITTFDSNESMYTKLLGGTVYDIIIPSDYMIERLISEEMVQPLDKSKLENMSMIYDQVLNMDFDPNNDYSVPYFWGNVGICYDKTLVDQADVESQGWNVLRNTKYKGMIYMYDSIRDSFMMAEKALGYSMNTDKEEEINAAYDWLIDIAQNMDPAYVTDEAIDGLANGEKAMGMMYSGDAALIYSENENMLFWAPAEGTNYFVDAMVIHKDAKNVENAYKFMNYITDYDAALENSVFVGYSSVNADVLKDLSAAGGDFEGNEAYIPRNKNANDEVFHNNEDVLKTISELWVKVKNTK